MDPASAAAVIIGNEVLSAKVQEANGAHLVKRLRERGVRLVAMHVVPDEIDPIVEAISLARRRARWVFTSGGIGPTHDDVTVRAVALALGRRVVHLPELVALVEAHFGAGAPAEALRLAEAPEGSELVYQPGVRYPALACAGVFMLPGVPQLFRVQLETVLARVPCSPVVLRALYLDASEAEIAGVLDAVALSVPHVAIGSYPTWDRDAGYRVKLTVEHEDAGQVEQVVQRLLDGLPSACVLRRE